MCIKCTHTHMYTQQNSIEKLIVSVVTCAMSMAGVRPGVEKVERVELLRERPISGVGGGGKM